MKTAYMLLAALVLTSACQTVEGFGQDVESGGQVIQDTSNDVQDDL